MINYAVLEIDNKTSSKQLGAKYPIHALVHDNDDDMEVEWKF